MRVITTRPLGSRQRENQASTEPGAVQLCLDDTFADAEPKTLRYGVLHTAVRLVRGQGKRKIEIPDTWPWARELEAAFVVAFALVPTWPPEHRPLAGPEEPRPASGTGATRPDRRALITERRITKAGPKGQHSNPVK